VRAGADSEARAALEMALPSHRVAASLAAHAFAEPSFTPGRPLAEAARELMHRIHTEFTYDTVATDVAHGRDFGDVTPMRGVLLGGGRHELIVGVDVARQRRSGRRIGGRVSAIRAPRLLDRVRTVLRSWQGRTGTTSLKGLSAPTAASEDVQRPSN
jgi:hypothetical protein